MRQYVIIGAGAAGVAAAEAIRSQDSTGRIILLSEEAEGIILALGWLSTSPESSQKPNFFLSPRRIFAALECNLCTGAPHGSSLSCTGWSWKTAIPSPTTAC